MILPVSVLALASSVLAVAGSEPSGQLQLSRRAAPDNPSGDYAPSNVTCPSDRPTIRPASSLSKSETDWLAQRRAKTVQPMVDFLTRNTIPDFDAAGYVNNHASNFSVVPNIGIGVSGGGYRALLNGAGFIAAADNRETGSTATGQIGGLLQSATYVAALSGGGWLVGSIFANNYTTVTKLRDGSPGSSVWEFSENILHGPKQSGLSIVNIASYWNEIVDDIDDKRDAGFSVSLTDPWGRALSYQLVNATDGGPAYTWSSIADADHFANADSPMPILVTVERAPGQPDPALNNSVVEFNPFEMGTFDPTFYGFAPTRYVGSDFRGGKIDNGGTCVRGLDQMGFVMGTSSSLFNYALISLTTGSDTDSSLPTFVTDMVKDILEGVSGESNDVAVWEPNPFRGFHESINLNADQNNLILVDGGMALENIPLQPLTQPLRAVDVIFAVDSSADSEYAWPNGTALRATYDRSKEKVANGTAFPAVPSANTFVNLGLNKKPTFFGCDTKNFTGSHIPPLVVYMPNAPYTYHSNITTSTMDVEDSEMYSIIQNGWNVATMGNNTVESDWTTCMSCAILSRSLARTGTTVPAACNTCFQKHCWNGTTDESTPSNDVTFIIGQTAGVAKMGAPGTGLLVAVLLGLFLI